MADNHVRVDDIGNVLAQGSASEYLAKLNDILKLAETFVKLTPTDADDKLVAKAEALVAFLTPIVNHPLFNQAVEVIGPIVVEFVKKFMNLKTEDDLKAVLASLPKV